MSKYTTKTLEQQIKEKQRRLQNETNKLFYKSFFLAALSVFIPPLGKKSDVYMNRAYTKMTDIDDETAQLNRLLDARVRAIQTYRDYKRGRCSRDYAVRQVKWYKQLEKDPTIKGPSQSNVSPLRILGERQSE